MKKKTARMHDQFAARVYLEWDAARSARLGLEDRWRVVEAMYRNEPECSGHKVVSEFPIQHIPLLRPKVERVINSVHTALTTVSPMALVLDCQDPEKASVLADQYDQFFSAGGGVRVLKRALTATALNGVGFLYASFDAERGWAFDAISPADMVVAPATVPSAASALLIGHRYYISESDYARGVDSGEYYDAGLLTPSDPHEYTSPRNPNYDRQTLSEGPALGKNGARVHELAQVFWYADLSDEQAVKDCLGDDVPEGFAWFRVVIEAKSQKLLALNVWPHARAPYFDVRLDDEPGKFWPSSSVGNNLQGLQNQYTQAWNLLTVGAYVSAFPPTFVTGLNPNTKLSIAKIGDVHKAEGALTVQTIPVQFDGSVFPTLIQHLEEVAEVTAGVPAPATGGTVTPNQTATATAYLQNMQMQAESSRGAHASYALEELWGYMHEVCQSHCETVQAVYGPKLQPGFMDALQVESPRFEMVGKVASRTPQYQSEQFKGLLELAALPQSGLNFREIVKRYVMSLGINGTDEFFTDDIQGQGLMGLAGMGSGEADSNGEAPPPEAGPMLG